MHTKTKKTLLVAGSVMAIILSSISLVRFATKTNDPDARKNRPLTFQCSECNHRFELSLSKFHAQMTGVTDLPAGYLGKATCVQCGARFSAPRVMDATARGAAEGAPGRTPSPGE